MKRGSGLETLKKELLDENDTCVSKSFWCRKYAGSKILASSPDFVLAIMKTYGVDGFIHALEGLKNDDDFIEKAILIKGDVFSVLKKEHKTKARWLKAFKESEHPLGPRSCPPDSLPNPNDIEILTILFSKYPNLYEKRSYGHMRDYFSYNTALRANPKIVFAAASKDAHLLADAPAEIINNKEFMLRMITMDIKAISRVGNELLFDKDIEGLIQKRAEKSLSSSDRHALTFYREKCEKLKRKSDATVRRYAHVLRQAKKFNSTFFGRISKFILIKIAATTADLIAHNRDQSLTIAASIFNSKTSGTTEATTTTNKIAHRAKRPKLER